MRTEARRGRACLIRESVRERIDGGVLAERGRRLRGGKGVRRQSPKQEATMLGLCAGQTLKNLPKAPNASWEFLELVRKLRRSHKGPDKCMKSDWTLQVGVPQPQKF